MYPSPCLATRTPAWPVPTPESWTTCPFDSAESVWFWFMAANQARIEGADTSEGAGGILRPCEPSDIFNILSRLHRGRVLLRDHFLVLRHYGRRFLAPDPTRPREVRAALLWAEAMRRMEPALIRRGIIVPGVKKQSKDVGHA